MYLLRFFDTLQSQPSNLLQFAETTREGSSTRISYSFSLQERRLLELLSAVQLTANIKQFQEESSATRRRLFFFVVIGDRKDTKRGRERQEDRGKNGVITTTTRRFSVLNKCCPI
jgi:hypothetical protein